MENGRLRCTDPALDHRHCQSVELDAVTVTLGDKKPTGSHQANLGSVEWRHLGSSPPGPTTFGRKAALVSLHAEDVVAKRPKHAA